MRIRAVLVSLALAAGGVVVAAPAAHAAGGTHYSWIGDTTNNGADTHSWTDSRNWSPSGVPADGDSVSIAPPGDECYAHVDNVPDVALQDFSLADSGSPGNLCQAGVSGGSISVAGTFTWHAGQIDSPTTLLPSSTGTVSPTTGVDASSALSQDMSVQGTLTLDGNLDQPSDSGQGILMSAGRTLTVASGGTLISNNSNDFDSTACCVNAARVDNEGTIRTNGGQLSFDGVDLDQQHILDTTSAGQVLITGTGIDSPDTASNGAQYTGDGSVLISGATMRLAGTQTLGPDFRLILGGVSDVSDDNIGGTFTLAGSGELDWKGGVLEAAMTVGAHSTLAATGSVSGNDHRELSGLDYTADSAGTPAAVINDGTVDLAGGADYYATDGGRIDNQTGGTLNLHPGTAISGDCCNNPGEIYNHGGTVAVPAGTSTAAAVLDNTIYKSAGGTTTVATGNTLAITGGATGALASTTVTGGGTLQVAAPVHLTKTVTVGAHTTVALQDHGSFEDVNQSGSTRETATLSGAGALAWTGGSVAGLLDLAVAGGVHVSGSVDKHVSSTSADNSPSTLTVTAPLTVAAGSSEDAPDTISVENNSTLNLSGYSTLGNFVHFYGGAVVNRGAVSVSPGSGGRVSVTGGANFTNRATVAVKTGTLAVDNDYRQLAGTTAVYSGAKLTEVGSSSAVKLSGGKLSGNGAVHGPVINSGATISPSGVGPLTLYGNYTAGSGATLYIDLAKGTSDRLGVHGDVVLRGHLIGHNEYSPKSTDQFSVVVATGSLTASLSCAVTSGTASTSRHWSPAVSGHYLKLHSVAGRKTSC